MASLHIRSCYGCLGLALLATVVIYKPKRPFRRLLSNQLALRQAVDVRGYALLGLLRLVLGTLLIRLAAIIMGHVIGLNNKAY